MDFRAPQRRALLHQYFQAALIALHSDNNQVLDIDPKYVVQEGFATMVEAERFIHGQP